MNAQTTTTRNPLITQLRNAMDEGRTIAAQYLLEQLDTIVSRGPGSYISFLESQRDGAFADLRETTAAHDALLADRDRLRAALETIRDGMTDDVAYRKCARDALRSVTDPRDSAPEQFTTPPCS